MTRGPTNPEQLARQKIDRALEASGWVVQDFDDMNLSAGQGVAVREFRLTTGFADYLLFVDGKAVGVLEAKRVGHTLIGVEGQAQKYTEGLPSSLATPVRPLPFMYLSTSLETRFANLLDPHPRSRRVFQVHRPETLAMWIREETLEEWTKAGGWYNGADDTKPASLRARLRAMPPIEQGSLYGNQVEAIIGLEHSLSLDKPRALIQMATGSGKTLMTVAAAYRLIKFGGARRVLFLVDRGNLGKQAKEEFGGYRPPDDSRKFTELYPVQHLTTNTIGASSKVVIATIQRLYSMLKGEPSLDVSEEDGSLFEDEASPAAKEPLPVVYNPTIPPEYFDFIVVDECHRSIYTLWRQVLEYFDAYLIGLTATPAAHTYGFFKQNLVMQYDHKRAVADGVNVDFEVYKVRTRITKEGSTIETGFQVGYRDVRTRQQRWAQADEAIDYAGKDLDRSVVAIDQIRTVVRAFRDKVLPEAFPHRRQVPRWGPQCSTETA